MKTLRWAWQFLWSRPLAAALNLLLLSLGLASITLVLLVNHQIQQAFARDLAGIDVVVGAKGSPLQLILSGVFQIDTPTGNVPLADVQTAEIGAGSRVWQFCVVLPGARIGRDCNVNAQCLIENDVVIGDRVTLKSGVQLWNGLRVEDDVFIGPNASFGNDRYPRSKRPPNAFTPTLLRRGASIGANATVLCGLVIGEGAMVGAGSVVTRDVPAGELWVGNPARSRGPAPRCEALSD